MFFLLTHDESCGLLASSAHHQVSVLLVGVELANQMLVLVVQLVVLLVVLPGSQLVHHSL